MSKKNKKPLPLLTNVHISDVAAEGKAIAKVDDLVIFVPFVVPGDVVDLQITNGRYYHTNDNFFTNRSR